VEESLALKDPMRVLLVESEEVTSVFAKAVEGVLNPPQLPHAPQPILSHQLQLHIQTLFLVRTTRLLERFSICDSKQKISVVLLWLLEAALVAELEATMEAKRRNKT